MSSLVRGEWHVSVRLAVIYRLLGGPEIARQRESEPLTESHMYTRCCTQNADVREMRSLNPQHELSADLRSSTSDVILWWLMTLHASQCLYDPMCQKINMFINFFSLAFRTSRGIYRNVGFWLPERKIGRLIKIRWTFSGQRTWTQSM